MKMVNVSVAIISQSLGFAYCTYDYNKYSTFYLLTISLCLTADAQLEVFYLENTSSVFYLLSLYMLAGFMWRFYFQSPFHNASGPVLCFYHWLDAPSPPSLHPADTPHRRSDTRESGAGPGGDGGGWHAAFKCCSYDPWSGLHFHLVSISVGK